MHNNINENVAKVVKIMAIIIIIIMIMANVLSLEALIQSLMTVNG